MKIALKCNAKVIGVNNRNLHTFQLDLDTTAKALQVALENGYSWKYDPNNSQLRPNITVISLSGVTSAQDVQQFKKLGTSGILVGKVLLYADFEKLFTL